MINITKTHLPNINKYKEYVDYIYKSGWITNDGALVRLLEGRLCNYLGVKHIVLVSNGTLALQIAYEALNLTGSVITTPFSFIATSSSIKWQGIKPIYVDINPETFNIDYKKIQKAITKDTSGIVPVHVFGNCCDVEKIDEIAKSNNLKVVYDAAHSFGVKYKGNSILNYGDISTLSFHATKSFHTIEGGALVIKDEEVYQKVKLMINFGIEKTGNIKYLGINGKMNEFEAAMGLCMLDEIDDIIKNRKIIYNNYFNEFKNLEGVKLQRLNSNCNNNYCYFPIVLKNEEIVLKIKASLEEKEIYARRYFSPSLNKVYFLNESNKVKESENLANSILCVPMYDGLDEGIQRTIINTVKEYVQ